MGRIKGGNPAKTAFLTDQRVLPAGQTATVKRAAAILVCQAMRKQAEGAQSSMELPRLLRAWRFKRNG
jgi:hypothetical protein